jgi:hypothetical protein
MIIKVVDDSSVSTNNYACIEQHKDNKNAGTERIVVMKT